MHKLFRTNWLEWRTWHYWSQTCDFTYLCSWIKHVFNSPEEIWLFIQVEYLNLGDSLPPINYLCIPLIKISEKIIKQAPSQKRCSVFCICLYFTLKRNWNSDIAKPPPRFLSPPQTYWCVCIIFQFKVNLNKLTFEFNGPFGQFKKMQCEIKQLKFFIRHPLARKYHRSPFKLTYVLNNLL